MTLFTSNGNLVFLMCCMASISTLSAIEVVSFLPEHRQSVVNLLMSSFFIDEPLNAMLQFDIPHEPLTWVDYIVDRSLNDQCSFVAINTETLYRDVIGVILNVIISNRSQEKETLQFTSDKLKFIFSLIDNVSRGYDLFELYRTDRVLNVEIINIDQNQRRQNLSTRLISASENKARQLGIQGASVVCSSLFSRKAFERQGYEIVNEVFYSEYDSKQLTAMSEHDRCTLLAKKL